VRVEKQVPIVPRISTAFFQVAMASTVLPDIEGFDSSQLQQILNDLDSQTQKAGKAKLPPISFSSEDERLKLEQGLHKAKRALIDVKRLEATSHLVHGDFDAAALEAGRALKLSLDVFGPGKIELVSCHLLLAEANLGLGRQKFTAEYLARANWCILKNPDCSNRLKSQLYRNFGKLYASQGKYDEALRQLANDIYFSSLQSGPEHVDTAGGYYYMATVFYLQSKVDSALGMCDKVVEIWMKEGKKLSPSALSESQVMEGVQVISKIVVLREEALGIDHVATGEACFVLGLLYNHANEPGKARGLIGKASKIYQQELGSIHPTTIDCVSRLQALGSNAGASAPLHSAAAAASTPVPQIIAAAVHVTSTSAADAQQSVSPALTAVRSEPAVAEQSVSAAPASVPSSSDVETASDGGAAPRSDDEAIPAAPSADAVADAEVVSGEAAVVAENATVAAGVDADDDAEVASGDAAVVAENATVADGEVPLPVENLAAAVASADDSAALADGAADESGVVQTVVNDEVENSEVIAEVAASSVDATSGTITAEPALAVQEGDVAITEGVSVTESNGEDATAAASADSEKSDA
jgi:tetratricopeptide (TPR) repeat protein